MKSYLPLFAIAVFFFAAATASYGDDIQYVSSSDDIWLSAGNWAGGNVPLATDVAQFGFKPTPGSQGVGIDMGGSTNGGPNQQDVGAIEVLNTRTEKLIIGNSSTSTGGMLRLMGATVNGIGNVILRNDSDETFTIQNTQHAGNQATTLVLGNPTNNVVNIDGSGDVVIGTMINDGASSSSLTVGGAGTGTLLLINVNSYTGGTTVNTGKTLQIGNGTLGRISDSGTLTDNGTVIIDRDGNYAYMGQIVGTGKLVKTGAGILTLNNAGTSYSGGTIISQGAVVWNQNNALGTAGAVTLNDDSTAGNDTSLYKNNSGRLSRNIIVANSGTGTTMIGNDAGNNTLPTIYSGSVTLNKSATLKSGAAALVQFSGPISGDGGVNIAGAGTVEFTSNNSYAGPTTVSSGTLLANNTTGSATGSGSVTVASNATLAGTGAISGPVTITAGGTLAPGNSAVGTLAVGSLSLTAVSSTFQPEIDLGNALAADLVNVTGTFSLANSTLDVKLLNAGTVATPLTFLLVQNDSFDSTIGQFGNITNPSGYGVTVNYSYSGTDAVGRVGDGNDLAITIVSLTAVPEAPAWLALATLSLCTAAMAFIRRKYTVSGTAAA